ncbi:MAG: sigma-54-dependent Fis family transcriptional regulator [Nitrospirae bacterium]|nr:sigma-54-dependent Fis family transcriptional regulator [Nitrospirota bacterium]
MREHILVVDDELGIRQTLADILQDDGYETSMASSGEEALERIAAHQPDLVMLDVWLPGMDGLDTLARIREVSTAPVIMISGHANIEMAVKATKIGSVDFMEKPLSLDKVLHRVKSALETARIIEENARLRAAQSRIDEMIGESAAMKELRASVAAAANSNGRVLILGESGAGKELVARSLHAGSPRAAKAFVEVNCAAIPQELIESELFGHEKGSFTGAFERKRGKFELADGGTLFLDEIGDMTPPTQAKVLRVIETQEFQRVGGGKTIRSDVRIISATNKNLEEEIVKGTFRQDLYYRLNVIPIHIPPLRQRRSDIPLLADYFLRKYAVEYGRKAKSLSDQALEALSFYDWPGNIRELKNVMERLVIMHSGETIDVSALPLAPRGPEGQSDYFAMSDLREARSAFEHDFILNRLKENGWNISRTADELGIERSNLHRKLKSLGIEAP